MLSDPALSWLGYTDVLTLRVAPHAHVVTVDLPLYHEAMARGLRVTRVELDAGAD